MKQKHLSALAAFLLLTSFASCAEAKKPDSDLPLFAALSEWLYRGAQPTEEGFRQLKEKGIKTVVNFRDEPELIEREKKEVEALGMNYVSLPWNIWRSVDRSLFDRYFETLDNPANRPVFIHCKHGRDRTGAISVLSVMRYEGLSEEEARKKAFQVAKPHLHYQPFVDQKIKFYLENEPVNAAAA